MANKDYEELARDILKNVGGEENVSDLRHCITRLRFNLKDEEKANTDYLKKRDGVVTVVKSAGQYQVVIGNEVANVYEAITDISNIGQGGGSPEPDNSDVSTLDRLIDTLSGLFQPFLGVLSAAGIIKGVGAIIGGLGVDSSSGLLELFNIIGDGFFQFLPVALTLTAARKFRMNEFTAFGIAAILLYPTLGALQDGELLYILFEGTPFASEIYTTFLGIPVILPPGGSYYGSVIPIILAIWFSSKVEKWVKSWMPKIISTFFTPAVTLLIAGTVSLLVVGPLATWGANLIGALFAAIYDFSPILLHVFLQAAWQVLVIFGLHWGIVPLIILQLTTDGFSPMGAAVSGSTFAIFGAIIAIWWKSKETKTKQIAGGSILPAFFGVTEPAIYGLMLPMRKVFIGAIVANAITGLYNGIFNLASYQMGGLGIFGIPNYIDPAGINTMNVWHRVISFVLATVLGFAATLIVGVPKIQDDEDEVLTPEPVGAGDSNNLQDSATVGAAQLQESAKQEIIGSPLSGQLVAQESINDEVFASGAMGKAIAVNPTDGTVYAPTNAIVTTIFPTGHAIGLTTEAGTEMLIHIGIDTVQLEGEGYDILVERGDKVKPGQPLVKFDIEKIKSKGYDVITPIVVTNTNEYADVLFTQETNIETGDYLLTSVR